MAVDDADLSKGRDDIKVSVDNVELSVEENATRVSVDDVGLWLSTLEVDNEA